MKSSNRQIKTLATNLREILDTTGIEFLCQELLGSSVDGSGTSSYGCGILLHGSFHISCRGNPVYCGDYPELLCTDCLRDV